MADCLIQTKPGPGIPESEFLASGHKKEIFEINFFGSIAKRIENETNRPNYFWWVTKTPASQAGKMAVMGRKAVRDRPWVKPPHPQQRTNESWNTQWARKRHHDHWPWAICFKGISNKSALRETSTNKQEAHCCFENVCLFRAKLKNKLNICYLK